jgi:hypothetical protein
MVGAECTTIATGGRDRNSKKNSAAPVARKASGSAAFPREIAAAASPFRLHDSDPVRLEGP